MMQFKKAATSILLELNKQIPSLTVEDGAKIYNALAMMYCIGEDNGSRSTSHIKPVEMLDENKKVIKPFDTVSHAANYLHVHKHSIYRVIDKDVKCNGFYFVYKK